MEESKVWLEMHLHVELPNSSELEEFLRNGVILARLANFFAPECIPERKIYDFDYKQLKKKGLHFKYTDNIVNFFKALTYIGFPKVFYPETTDIYDMKNMPKLIYCIHALSYYLSKLGIAHPIQDLFGQVQFSDAELNKVSESLKKYGVQMPAFSKIGGILASELSEDDAALHAAILLINEAIENNDELLFLDRLKNPSAQLFGVNDECRNDYFVKMSKMRSEKISKISGKENEVDVYDRILTQKEIQSCLSMINKEKKLIQITHAARINDENKLINCLTCRDLGARGVLYDNRDLYLKHMNKAVMKQSDDYIFDLETVNELVSKGNLDADLRKRVVQFVTALNEDIMELDCDKLNYYIEKYKVDLGDFNEQNIDSYVQWIKNALEIKIKDTNDLNVGLWFDEIKKCIFDANSAIKDSKVLIDTIEKLNQSGMSVNEMDLKQLDKWLNDLSLHGIVSDCLKLFANSIQETVLKQNFVEWNGWTEHRLIQNSLLFCYNYNDKKYLWFKKADLQENHGYINREKIQLLINEISTKHDYELYLIANTSQIEMIQSFIRAYQTRKAYLQRPHILTLQSFTRLLKVLNLYIKTNEFNKKNKKEIEALSTIFKSLLVRNQFKKQYSLFKNNIDKIQSIQNVIRAGLAYRDYNNLVHSDNPPCNAVCRFVRLLEVDSNDIKEENELERLRNNVIKMIKQVGDKENENRDFDVRIGLLVKNKLKLQDVIASNAGKSKKFSEQFLPTITKEKQVLVDKLGTLFYTLQMNPEYTAQLILRFFGDRNSKFIKETCFALYNYGTYLRDEYTLLKMFSRAMSLEVETKIESLQEFLRGDPLITKIVVNYYRNSKAQTWLEEIISDCVKDIVNNKYSINTNPLDIYKQWISQMETETGEATSYPYDVDTQTAMSYDEVKKRLSVNISNMKEVCTKFVTAITSSASKMPYGVRYVARVLFDSLKQQFPNEEESSYFKVISNFLYYRLINPAIVSPDTFNMLTSAEISAEKRKNLASISVVIQRSASHNFSVNSSSDNPMFTLNDYMANTWNKMVNWFNECIQIDTLETHFNIDEFTDQTAINRPELNLTIGQIIEVHGMLKNYIVEHNVSEDDPIVIAMNDIGELPNASDLIERKKSMADISEEQLSEMAKNVSFLLPLIPPKIQDQDNEQIKRHLFNETIKLVVDLMNFETTNNFGLLLNKQFSIAKEKEFAKLQTRRSESSSEFKQNIDVITPMLTLKETQEKIKENTLKLEELGIIIKSENYETLVMLVAKEIRNRRLYRKNRRFDLLRMRSALDNLNAKDKYLDEQKDYYQQYIQACVANLNTSKKSKSSKNKKIVKYNAAELYKQGVVLEVEGLPTHKFKNVQFEICTTEVPGTFLISAKLYGVSIDSMQLVFQDLLQLQYENVSVISMFDRAKINVNLLIYTINKKFYSKK